MRIEEIDWNAWEPQQRATLLFVIHGGEILLIRKKRGLGAGKINGPGGLFGLVQEDFRDEVDGKFPLAGGLVPAAGQVRTDAGVRNDQFLV